MNFFLAECISFIGGKSVMIPFICLIVALLVWKKKYHVAYVVAASTLLTSLLTYIFKIVFAVPRPVTALIVEDGFRFPSGHVSLAAILSILVVYYARHAQSVWVRWVAYILACVWLALVAWARLFLGVHVLVDVIAGIAVAIISFVIIQQGGALLYAKSKYENTNYKSNTR